MYFDVNVDGRYPIDEANALLENECDGMCFNNTVDARDVMQMKQHDLLVLEGKQVFRRVEIRYSRVDELPSMEVVEAIRRTMKCIVAVLMNESRDFEAIMRIEPDIIAFDFSKRICFPDKMVEEAAKKNIFFELRIAEGLYMKKEKTIWMRNIRKLLAITKGVNVIVSSGAACNTEVKRPFEFVSVLQGVGVDESCARRVLMNSARMLRSCKYLICGETRMR
ncbi:putative subunit p30 of RNase P/RNase MRP [Ordospora colligata]|uniref:Putative subunit p30 of RNase P/RNase MRP n=1 Tax=Ordospora colligata OC4 TaxID=1354746 RepID=A0A0B2UIM1_9MICR|nr:putative subunit p30 of RNase P/RNase MRP [Ordospora colligata OC4]KHN69193.1 putative subunit p30 of RNase P/RNase MRP [Ordospora colligata OC4]TBU14471.1 putative subunit p30 of RNase P/RNase MRP [Ordospora colligata]TBU14648.1 putative subunit p30 of RNase P/RNase MRP [Ordospora colligata]TBU18033.1 putative subunit p30 of RNase P/RNase MRP [Ordospora colligata]